MGAPVETGGAQFANALGYLWCTWSPPAQLSGGLASCTPLCQGALLTLFLEPGLLKATEHSKVMVDLFKFLFLGEGIFWEALL